MFDLSQSVTGTSFCLQAVARCGGTQRQNKMMTTGEDRSGVIFDRWNALPTTVGLPS
jgi:hypothetical protein